MSLHKELLDFDPDTGLRTYIEFPNDDSRFEIRYEQDVQATLDALTPLRNDEDRKKDGIKRSWWHVAHIPDIVILKLRSEHGLDVFNPNHTKRISQLIQSSDYLRLHCTSGRWV